MSKKFDFFVIGGGSGGVRAARIAAGHGAKVGLAEGWDLGGTCVNRGCVPKKLMVYAADYRKDSEDARGFGWKKGRLRHNWTSMIRNINDEVRRLNGVYKKLLKDPGVKIYDGYAKFVSDHELDIEGEIIRADNILIATGGTPHLPEIPGKEHLITSDEVFHLDKRPKHIVIIGAGYIGVEFAHVFHGLGSKVTIINRSPTVLSGFDKDIRQNLIGEMEKQGIDLRLGCNLQRVDRKGDKTVIICDDGKDIKCDLALAATGRTPLTADLGLDAAGIDMLDNGQIAVDEQYRSSVPHIYAIGDVANRHNLTPVATAEGHILADRLFSKKDRRRLNYDMIPTAVFSDPPIGTVGLTDEQAAEAGYKTAIYESRFKPLKHTVSGRDEKTYMKLVVDEKTDRVLGLHMMGADAPEITQGFAVAMNAGATKADFDRTIGIHPTAAEEFVTMRTPG